MPKLDPNDLPDPSVLLESFEHPQHGWLDYDPHTLAIVVTKPITKPIGLPEKFIGVKQPGVPTCSEPVQGNAGCPKWHGCPLKKFPYIGPGQVLMRKKDAYSVVECHEFFSEKDARGNLVYQVNWVEQGWKMDTSRTTTPITGMVPQFNQLGQKSGQIRTVWQKSWPDLLPYWWPLLKKEGKPLPESAKRYPQFAEDEEEQSTPKSGSPEPLPSVSRGGRKKRRKAVKRSARGSGNARSAPPSLDTPAPDA